MGGSTNTVEYQQFDNNNLYSTPYFTRGRVNNWYRRGFAS